MAATTRPACAAVSAVFGVVAVLVAACSPKSDCDLGAALQQRAGAGARDCGHAAFADSGVADVDECVTAAFTAKKAFFAEFDRRGTDSRLVFGIARDDAGRVTTFLYDSDPSGGSKVGANIDAEICTDPTVVTPAGGDSNVSPPIACGSTTSLGQICGSRP